MVDFSKLPGTNNKQALIDNAVAYHKHPRNTATRSSWTTVASECEPWRPRYSVKLRLGTRN